MNTFIRGILAPHTQWLLHNNFFVRMQRNSI